MGQQIDKRNRRITISHNNSLGNSKTNTINALGLGDNYSQVDNTIENSRHDNLPSSTSLTPKSGNTKVITTTAPGASNRYCLMLSDQNHQ